MIDCIHKFFRDRVTGVMLAVCCIFIGAMVGESFKLVNAIIQKETEWYYGKNKTHSSFTARPTIESSKLEVSYPEIVFKECDSCILETPYGMLISGAMDQHPVMVMKDKEAIVNTFYIKKNYSDDSASVFVGEDLVNSSSTIILGGVVFKIAGTLNNNSLGSDDERIVIAYDSLDDKQKQIINNNAAREMWLHTAEGASDNLKVLLRDKYFNEIGSYDSEGAFYSKNFDKVLINYVQPAILIFCIIDLIIASIMWYRRQKHNRMVLKCNGATKDEIYVFLGKTYFRCVLPGIIVGIVIMVTA